MADPYPGYAECRARRKKVLETYDSLAALDRIQANIDAADRAAAWKDIDRLVEQLGVDEVIAQIKHRHGTAE